jgi:uncharacterized membrane protein (TIGR02234 family)
MRRAEYALALLVLAVGSGAVLLLSTREWQTVRTVRAQPLTDDVLGLSGRTVDAAPTALALVSLAGVVAVLATRGWVRRLIGVLVLLAGAGLVWRSAAAVSAVSPARARDLVRAKHPRAITSASTVPHVVTHPVWGLLSVVAAVLVVVAGAVIAWRGARWGTMSARYERPVRQADIDPQQARARRDASMWSALERGEDPTDSAPADRADGASG